MLSIPWIDSLYLRSGSDQSRQNTSWCLKWALSLYPLLSSEKKGWTWKELRISKGLSSLWTLCLFWSSSSPFFILSSEGLTYPSLESRHRDIQIANDGRFYLHQGLSMQIIIPGSHSICKWCLEFSKVKHLAIFITLSRMKADTTQMLNLL